MCLKRPITVPFERSEPFHLLRLMGVSVPSLHIESTDSMILSLNSFFQEFRVVWSIFYLPHQCYCHEQMMAFQIRYLYQEDFLLLLRDFVLFL